MKEFIYPEMMVHVPLCTHKDPKDILVLSDNPKALEIEIQKHDGSSADLAKPSLDALRDKTDSSCDIVLCEMAADAAVLAHISRVLREDGLVVMKHLDLDQVVENKNLMEMLFNYFKIIMPYRLEDGTTLLLASKAYHPTADIILQRSDMLDGLEYYNCDIHIAAFAMPNYIRKNYLGIIKN